MPSQTINQTSTNPSTAIARALRHALRPIVRLMLARGITLPYLLELVKTLLVEVADEDFRIDNKPPTDSRISLLSGVHRKDVSRLREMQLSLKNQFPSAVPLGAQLIAQWQSNPQYVDETGQAKPLTRNASKGGADSFEALVAGVNKDIRSRVVLDEWMRSGAVTIDELGRVCLNTHAFVPSPGADEKIYYFGHNLHDHAAAAVHNLSNENTAFMDRSVHYTGLSLANIQTLQAQSEALGMQALLSVNKTAAEQLKSNSATDGQQNQRMTFGIYFYTEPCDQAHPSSTPSKKKQP